MRNAYDAAMGVSAPIEIGGPVEIIGDRAVAVAEVDKPATYTEGKYAIQDRIDIGFPQNAQIIAPGMTLMLETKASSPFKPEEFIIDSGIASDVSVMSIDIGSTRYVEGGPIPGSTYSEVSTTRRVSWRTVQTGVSIQVVLRNDTVAPLAAKASIRGARLV